MKCRDCPMINDEFNNRMRWYYESIANGTVDEIYGDMTVVDVEDNAEEYCWCEKMGYKLWLTGNCDKEEICNSQIISNKSKKSTKRSRRDKYIKRLRYLESIANYPQPVMYIDEKWDKDERKYISVDKPYYKRLYRNNHKGGRHRFYKNFSNKKVRNYGIGTYEYDEDFDLTIYPYRKSDGELKIGGSYKKVFDYWWTAD